jgi:hypothetical protein
MVQKKLKKLIYTNNCMENCKISKILGSNLISDSYADFFFVTGNHNKTERFCQLEHFNNKAATCYLERSYLGSDLVLNHPSGVSTPYFHVTTFQKRTTLAESPLIPTTQHVPGRRPPRWISDP